jgi:hypothetical protein
MQVPLAGRSGVGRIKPAVCVLDLATFELASQGWIEAQVAATVGGVVAVPPRPGSGRGPLRPLLAGAAGWRCWLALLAGWLAGWRVE